MGTGGSFPGGKARPGRDADHSPPLVPRLRKSRRLILKKIFYINWPIRMIGILGFAFAQELRIYMTVTAHASGRRLRTTKVLTGSYSIHIDNTFRYS
jgi:hypothetical protein